MSDRRADLTFQYNLKQGRHGWLRLTPAYSIKLVYDLIERNPQITHVLDPFAGTGTTAVACAERGIRCTLLDINPFLIWLAQAKTANYSSEQIAVVRQSADAIIQIASKRNTNLWVPPLHNLSRWWSADRLTALAGLYQAIKSCFPDQSPEQNLLLIAFCRVMIEWSNATFNHQSMSFKTDTAANQQLSLFDTDDYTQVLDDFVRQVEEITESAQDTLFNTIRLHHRDARHVPQANQPYDCVITSPPYPNRMSYIRELRPYMYWLGYLNEAREAGELDWQAIGGTWGIATSRLNLWQPDQQIVPYVGFQNIIDDIARTSSLLAAYVHKYFVDIAAHIRSLYPALISSGRVYYVVGNSKFYNTLVPVEEIYASILEYYGFANIQIENIRKRNSKKELYEFIVSAYKPES